jgi:hypothetical protein
MSKLFRKMFDITEENSIDVKEVKGSAAIVLVVIHM